MLCFNDDDKTLSACPPATPDGGQQPTRFTSAEIGLMLLKKWSPVGVYAGDLHRRFSAMGQLRRVAPQKNLRHLPTTPETTSKVARSPSESRW
jgi:hypothetical protein